MSEGWFKTLASCTGKATFATPQIANKVQRRRSKKRRSYKVKQQVYHCKACGLFHIGTPTKPGQDTKSGRRPRRAVNREGYDSMGQ